MGFWDHHWLLARSFVFVACLTVLIQAALDVVRGGLEWVIRGRLRAGESALSRVPYPPPPVRPGTLGVGGVGAPDEVGNRVGRRDGTAWRAPAEGLMSALARLCVGPFMRERLIS